MHQAIVFFLILFLLCEASTKEANSANYKSSIEISKRSFMPENFFGERPEYFNYFGNVANTFQDTFDSESAYARQWLGTRAINARRLGFGFRRKPSLSFNVKKKEYHPSMFDENPNDPEDNFFGTDTSKYSRNYNKNEGPGSTERGFSLGLGTSGASLGYSKSSSDTNSARAKSQTISLGTKGLSTSKADAEALLLKNGSAITSTNAATLGNSQAQANAYAKYGKAYVSALTGTKGLETSGTSMRLKRRNIRSSEIGDIPRSCRSIAFTVSNSQTTSASSLSGTYGSGTSVSLANSNIRNTDVSSLSDK